MGKIGSPIALSELADCHVHFTFQDRIDQSLDVAWRETIKICIQQ
jgi:hypothetical protein